MPENNENITNNEGREHDETGQNGIKSVDTETNSNHSKQPHVHEPQDQIIPTEKISLWFLLSHIKLSHLWGLIIIIFSLISGSVVLTYQFANKKSDAQLLTENARFEVKLSEKRVKIADLNIEISKITEILNKKLSEYSQLEIKYNDLVEKENLLSQYLDYMLAYRKYTESELANTNSTVDATAYKNNLKFFAKKLKELNQKFNNGQQKSIKLRKNVGSNDATITFMCDDSKWPIPPEIVAAGIF